jgi:hypothetical protein
MSGVLMTATNAAAIAPRPAIPERQDADFCRCAVQDRRISAAMTMGVRASAIR